MKMKMKIAGRNTHCPEIYQEMVDPGQLLTLLIKFIHGTNTYSQNVQLLTIGRERRAADKTSGKLQIGHLPLVCRMSSLLPRALWLSTPLVNDASVSKSQIL
jgi:hypothetical protein